jgi:hypothetical protein
MINQPPESRFAASLKPFFDSIDPNPTFDISGGVQVTDVASDRISSPSQLGV